MLKKFKLSFMIKLSTLYGYRGSHSFNKDHVWKTEENIVLNSENLKAFALRSRNKTGMPILTFIQYSIKNLSSM